MRLFSFGDKTPRSRTHRSIATIAVILCVLSIGMMGALFLTPHQAKAASWTQVWGDDFTGSAGTAPNAYIIDPKSLEH